MMLTLSHTLIFVQGVCDGEDVMSLHQILTCGRIYVCRGLPGDNRGVVSQFLRLSEICVFLMVLGNPSGLLDPQSRHDPQVKNGCFRIKNNEKYSVTQNIFVVTNDSEILFTN